ncbi:hypothetical protein [Streptomyces sp. G-G2]|uniref:hypothetical protein n=1 Tax=Streptomyces sp. G-G2 TaxID=3046201 RepID=UPI0024B8F19B|nr:hypothetical protein [Streptomyces sp. G-G2]MDJ0383116.1 hypothetical protein [Streptomyces sp. G-G2]
MQLRRAVPLSLAVLLAGTGCVCVGAHAPAPSHTPVPPADSPVLPLGRVPDGSGTPPGPLFAEPDGAARSARPSPDASARDARRADGQEARPSAPRRTSPRKSAPSRPRHPIAPAPARVPGGPGMDELCAAAEGAVPPSVVDLCVGQYDR